MATKAAKKKTARKTPRARGGSTNRRANDPLRELLEFVMTQLERAPQATRDIEGIEDLFEPLQIAIDDLEENPGQDIGH